MDHTPGMAAIRNSEPAGHPHSCGRGRRYEACWWKRNPAFGQSEIHAIKLPLQYAPLDYFLCAGFVLVLPRKSFNSLPAPSGNLEILLVVGCGRLVAIAAGFALENRCTGNRTGGSN